MGPASAFLTVLLFAVMAGLMMTAVRAGLRMYYWRRALDRVETHAWRRVLDELRSS